MSVTIPPRIMSGNPENPCWLDDAVAADGGRVGGANAAEHGHDIVANGGVFAEIDVAEEVDDIVRDAGVGIEVNVAEEDDNVVIGMLGDVNVAEKDHNIVIDGSLSVYAAEEADGVVHGLIGTDHNLAAKLHGIPIGMGRRGG